MLQLYFVVNMVADIQSDASSGSFSNKHLPRVQVQITEDVEKANHHDGLAVREGRKHSDLDRDEDEDDDEDLDALIEELESNDPDAEVEEEIEIIGGVLNVPEELLQTDTRVGLIEPEVNARRKKYGLNQMKEEKENLFLKFLGYFVGPIQFVMEVRSHGSRSYPSSPPLILTLCDLGRSHPCRWSGRLGGLWCDLCPSPPQRYGRLCARVSSRFNSGRTQKNLGSQSCRAQRGPTD